MQAKMHDGSATLVAMMFSMDMHNVQIIPKGQIDIDTLTSSEVIILCVSTVWLRQTNHHRELWSQLLQEVQSHDFPVLICFSERDDRYHWKLQSSAPDLLRLHGDEPTLYQLPKSTLEQLGFSNHPDGNHAVHIRNGEVVDHMDITIQVPHEPTRLSA